MTLPYSHVKTQNIALYLMDIWCVQAADFYGDCIAGLHAAYGKLLKRGAELAGGRAQDVVVAKRPGMARSTKIRPSGVGPVGQRLTLVYFRLGL